MALTRSKPNVNGELFHQRYSELSDEIRAKNKREDRLLDARLKYYEREKNIRVNILRKNQYQLERTRSALLEQLTKIQQDKQRQTIPPYISDKVKFESTLLQLSVPVLFNTDSEPHLNLIQSEFIPTKKPITPTNIIRPHSAG